MLREKGSVDGRPRGGDGGNTVGSLCYWKLAVLTVFNSFTLPFFPVF